MFKVSYSTFIVIIRHYLWYYFSSLRNLSRQHVEKLKKKTFYLNLKHKFRKASCITRAHFDEVHMLISA